MNDHDTAFSRGTILKRVPLIDRLTRANKKIHLQKYLLLQCNLSNLLSVMVFNGTKNHLLVESVKCCEKEDSRVYSALPKNEWKSEKED